MVHSVGNILEPSIFVTSLLMTYGGRSIIRFDSFQPIGLLMRRLLYSNVTGLWSENKVNGRSGLTEEEAVHYLVYGYVAPRANSHKAELANTLAAVAFAALFRAVLP